VQPAYLLLDEPFAGLDLITKTKLLEEITTLAKGRKLTIVLVTHDPIEATTLCRSALVLSDGHIEESGPLAELLQAPRSELLSVFRSHLWKVGADSILETRESSMQPKAGR
jgi:ABC-type sulfate/molybdate transport systems ATPase subunit